MQPKLRLLCCLWLLLATQGQFAKAQALRQGEQDPGAKTEAEAGTPPAK